MSGVFPIVSALEAGGAEVTVHDPLLTEAELAALGFAPHRIGSPVDAVVVQADHGAYRELGPEQFPGVRAALDGRGVLDQARWVTGQIDLMLVGVGQR